MRCSYGSAKCDAALTVFNEDDWLASTGKAGHLFDSLTWLLRAAQEWQLQSDLGLGVEGYSAQVYAMDSVFLRARGLFEFFLKRGQNYCHAHCLFGLTSQLSAPTYFVQWEDELHIGAMHLQQRHIGAPLNRHDGSGVADLNQMPVDIAKGVLEVWENFEKELGSNGSPGTQAKAKACRLQAISDSKQVVAGLDKRAAAYATAPHVNTIWS